MPEIEFYNGEAFIFFELENGIQSYVKVTEKGTPTVFFALDMFQKL